MFSDVDSAYATIESNLTLLRPYKDTYLKEAVEVRDTVSFAYTRGGASLLDFLQAQQDYRSTELNYLNLVGSYLTDRAIESGRGTGDRHSMKRPEAMKNTNMIAVAALASLVVSLILAGCGQKVEANPKLGEPPPDRCGP